VVLPPTTDLFSALPVRVPVEDIVQVLRHPPCAPKIIPLLKRRLLDVNAPIPDIVDLIRLDPGVAARVLQTANSVVYSRGDRCISVEGAVNRIGFDNIFGLVADAVAEQVLVRPLATYGVEAEDFWLRSVACALAAEQLGRICDEDEHVAYALGLFHGVGMVAIDHWACRHAPTLAFQKRAFPRDYLDGERALLGCTHAEVGASLLRAWEFPPEMADPLRWQYAPLEALGHRRLACLLHAARWLAISACGDGEGAPPPPPDAWIAPIRLKSPALLRELAVLRARLEEVRRRLDEAQPKPER
jgi:HD-like signal output (HDOD) protein